MAQKKKSESFKSGKRKRESNRNEHTEHKTKKKQKKTKKENRRRSMERGHDHKLEWKWVKFDKKWWFPFLFYPNQIRTSNKSIRWRERDVNQTLKREVPIKRAALHLRSKLINILMVTNWNRFGTAKKNETQHFQVNCRELNDQDRKRPMEMNKNKSQKRSRSN